MALITAAQARVYLPHLTGTGEDTTLTVLIGRADAAMAGYCGYPPTATQASATMEAATYTEYYGPDDHDGRTLRLGIRPVASITSISDDPDWAYSSTVSSGDYVSELRHGWVMLKSGSTPTQWSDDLRAIKVVMSAGYTVGSPPSDLAQMTALLVRYWWDRRETGEAEDLFAVPFLPRMVREGLFRGGYVLDRVRAWRSAELAATER